MLADQTQDIAQAEVLVERRPKVKFAASLLGFARHKPLGAAGGLVVATAILIAVLAPLLAPYDPQDIGVAVKFTAPFTAVQ